MPEGFGFNAWISTDDDEPLPEYGVETDMEKNVVTCWIPSEAGKSFKIKWNNLAHYEKNTFGSVRIDGARMRGKINYKSTSVSDIPVIMDSVTTSPTIVRKFVFSPLKLTDDDSLLTEPAAHNIGNISLEMKEVIVGERKSYPAISVCEHRTAHEKLNKGVVHCVRFSTEQERPNSKTYRSVSPGIQTFGKFIFRYRPLDVLQANGIAPRDPSPEPASAQPDRPSESHNKRKADAIKEEDVDENDAINDGSESEEIESIRARLRELEREKEMDDLRARLRKLERKRGNAKRVKTAGSSPCIDNFTWRT